MKVHWRSLIVFGITFWVVLCLNDFFGGMPRYHFCELYQDREELSILDKDIYENFDDMKRFIKETQFGHRLYKFGWTLLLWNTFTFIFCISFCFCAKTLSWVLWKIFVPGRSGQQILQMTALSTLTRRSNSSLSKIPVKVRQSCGRSSDTNINLKLKVNQDASCPNLLAKQLNRDSSTANFQAFYDSMETVPINPQCQTIYKNDLIFPGNENERKFDKHLENQREKLKEEMAKLQADSLKEHAILSRKLDDVTKEKKDIVKLLTAVQKENRAAKQQMEELMQEKAALVKRLENATKEFKSNTRTKKFALQKLDEAIANADNFKKQLEQVSRDKEILEGKLKLLEKEYEKLQERVIMSSKTNLDSYQQHKPERDSTDKKPDPVIGHLEVSQVRRKLGDSITDMNLSSVSQTEIDMKKIQVKIKQLEKNLENFNTNNPMGFQNAEAESEISLSGQGNATDTARTEETDTSDFFGSSPSLRYWGGRAGDMISALATRMNERVNILSNIRETRSEHGHTQDLSTSSSPDIRPLDRIVSSSAAFQNFLKSLHNENKNHTVVYDTF